MAGRKRHTPEQIIRKLRHGDELAATGIDVEEMLEEFKYKYDPEKRKEVEEQRKAEAQLALTPPSKGGGTVAK